MELIGRSKERALIKQCYDDKKSHFIAVYGRRRVGKTFLIRKHFGNDFTFYITGLAHGNKEQQIANFHLALNRETHTPSPVPKSWLEAFDQLTKKLERSKKKKKVIFIDELPWMDTPRSGFITGLEYFWNSWASGRDEILLIGCGSSASWMLNKLINNKKGLYNRVTKRIKLKQFSLYEVEQFLKEKKYKIDRYQIIQLYMAMGGIPFYLDLIDTQLSVAQNINRLCFEDNAQLQDEYRILFQSLFGESDIHQEIIDALSSKQIGLSRKAILEKISTKDGGGFKRALSDLESSDFIREYKYFGKQKRGTKYQLIDAFTLFHQKHIVNALNNDNYWLSQINTPTINTWQGNAFEILCLLHIDQIKKAIGISGVNTNISSWWGKGAQVDLVIDRQDRVINLVEIKFSIDKYEITKKYDEVLRNKISSFISYSKTKKSVWMALVTTFGLKNNAYAGNVQQVLTMNDLFEAK